jgi:hypothetical protein
MGRAAQHAQLVADEHLRAQQREQLAGQQLGGDGAEHAVEFAVQQPLDEFAHPPLLDLHAHARHAPAQPHYRARHRRRHRQGSQAQHAGRARAQGLHFVSAARQLTQDHLGAIDGGLAQRIGRQALRAALEQPCAEAGLDLGQHLAQGGLAQVHAHRGQAQGACLCQHRQQFEVAQPQPAQQWVGGLGHARADGGSPKGITVSENSNFQESYCSLSCGP